MLGGKIETELKFIFEYGNSVVLMENYNFKKTNQNGSDVKINTYLYRS